MGQMCGKRKEKTALSRADGKDQSTCLMDRVVFINITGQLSMHVTAGSGMNAISAQNIVSNAGGVDLNETSNVVAVPQGLVQPQMVERSILVRETRDHHYFHGHEDNRYILETRNACYQRPDSPDGCFFFRTGTGQLRSVYLNSDPALNIGIDRSLNIEHNRVILTNEAELPYKTVDKAPGDSSQGADADDQPDMDYWKMCCLS